MSLPAREERALDGMADALRAADPHLVGMFTIFARLNAGEPVTEEPRARRRKRRWLRRGPALSAFVLIPVAFALIIIGAVFGGARSVKTCVVAPLVNRAACQTYRPAATGQKMTAVGSGHGAAPAWPPR
jgi:Protein of unknown function (DUF3040)